MRDYATIRSRFWTHGTGKALRNDPLARLLAVYLMSCPSSTMTGIYYLPIPTLAHELGCSTEGAWKALRRVIKEGFASYDEDDELVFVHGLAREQVGRELKPGDNRRKSIIDQLEKWTNHRFFWGFVQLYGEKYGLPYDLNQCPFEAPLEPLRSQRTESSRSESRDQDQVTSLATGVGGGLTPPPQTADGLELVTPSKPTKRKAKQPTASTEVWLAYAEAYRDRYGCDPIRNAKVNGQLSQFVQRVPRDEAPQIVRHYLRSHNARYTASGHSAGCLLQDAEKLRTEALTGRATTSYAARQADAKQGRGQKYAGVIAKLEREAEEEERQAREVSSGNA